jgi:hypothetical protein
MSGMVTQLLVRRGFGALAGAALLAGAGCWCPPGGGSGPAALSVVVDGNQNFECHLDSDDSILCTADLLVTVTNTGGSTTSEPPVLTVPEFVNDGNQGTCDDAALGPDESCTATIHLIRDDTFGDPGDTVFVGSAVATAGDVQGSAPFAFGPLPVVDPVDDA